MYLLRRLPAFFSILFIAALLTRAGFPLILLLPLTVMLLGGIFVPWSQVRKVMAAVLGLLSLPWVFMTWLRVSERLEAGGPWIRVMCILGGVALFTAWSGWLLLGPRDETPAA